MAILEDTGRTDEIVAELESNPEVEHVTVVRSYNAADGSRDVYLKVWLYETSKVILPVMKEYGLSVGMAKLDLNKGDRPVLMVTLGVD